MNPATIGAPVTFPSDEDVKPLHVAAQDLGGGPLHGIRVLDLTRVLSGPHAARMLCDLGADVIKVEPPAGDLTRFTSPRAGGLTTYFIQQNVGKRNISVDMSMPRGVQLLLDLAAKSDVVIENFRPGVMQRLGLGYDAVAAVNQRVVYASINGYGSTGPWTTRRAYAPVIGAETGYLKAQCDARAEYERAADGDGDGDGDSSADAGDQARSPVRYVNDVHSHGDVYTGAEAASGIIAALFQRERTGRGQRVEVSMAQTLLYVNEHAHDLLWDGDPSPEWIRSFRPGDYLALVVGNGETVMISGHPAEQGTFELFVSAMQRPEWSDDPRFATVATRLANFHVLVAEMGAWALTQPDPATAEAALAGQRLAMGVVRSVRDIADSEWAAARNAIVSVPDRMGGVVRVPNSPWVFSGAVTGVQGEPKFRGEDNAAVMREVLGLDDADVAQLVEDGVLSSRLPSRAR